MLVRIEVRHVRRGGAAKLKECRASVRDKRIRLDFVQGAFVSGE